MTKMTHGKIVRRLGNLISILALSAASLGAKDAKMKPEELVAKHVASIGTPEAIAAAHNRAITGVAQVIFRLPNPGQLIGKGHIYSEGRQYHVGMDFAALEYPAEQLAFDGSKVTVGQVQPGKRSNLSAFVYQFDALLKDGLIGGAMTTAWALLDVAGRQPKLDYTGLKKIEGKQLHELKYRARKGAGDLQMALYFDPETFHHVSTLYRLLQPSSMGRTPSESSSQRDTVYSLVESFSDFKTVDSLTLPSSYKLVLTIEGQNATVLVEYNIAATQLLHNQTLDPKLFSIQ